ncbi:uncharacterized protein LOC144607157 isoform X2 [Rhinoraja longicauda]
MDMLPPKQLGLVAWHQYISDIITITDGQRLASAAASQVADIRHPRGRTHMDPESPPSLHVKQLPLPPLAVDNFRVWCDWPRPTDGVCHGARADAAPGGVIPEAMLH